MYDLKNKTYVVLEFVTIDGYLTGIETVKDKFDVHLNYPTIIELAAVKIEDGKIIGSYSTFIGIDGCDPHNCTFDSESPELNGITAEHLIGAPSLYDAAERLFDFASGCTIITRFSEKDSRNPFHIIKNYVEPVGYAFNNPIISVNSIITAIKISDEIEEAKAECTKIDAYRLSLSLEYKEGYADLVAHYLDCDAESGRQDSLSRALLIARLFIALLRADNQLKPIDENDPF